MKVEHDGDKMTVTMDEDGTNRKCGSCTLCCRLIPVASIDKKAGERCQHQFSRGCRIYWKRPVDCRIWTCMWLSNPKARELRRPDRMHYVVDMMSDTIYIVPNEGDAPIATEVLQVWCDPLWPDAHRDPALRRYIDLEMKLAIVRYGSNKGFVLFPPSRSSDGLWHEQGSSAQMPGGVFPADAEKAAGYAGKPA